MKPLGPEPKITQAYKNSVTGRINHFYNKNWPGKSANGAFLVAKNGQIIFEKYDGLANFSKKNSITKKAIRNSNRFFFILLLLQ